MASHLSTGADNIKKYWSRYYQGSQGVVFVLDSASSDEDLEAARNELHSALQHPQLCTLPFLILANHQDKPAARTPNQVTKPTHSYGVDLFLFPFFYVSGWVSETVRRGYSKDFHCNCKTNLGNNWDGHGAGIAWRVAFSFRLLF